MTYRARLRVELPNRPGALAAVTGILGHLHANVVGVDAQEADAAIGVAVTEIVADLPDDLTPADVRRALVAAGSVGTLVAAGPARAWSDPVSRVVDWTGRMAAAHPSDRNDVLAHALAELCGASTAWVTTGLAEARQWAAGRAALERGAPVIHQSGDLPVSRAPDLVAGGWVLAVPDGSQPPQRVAFLARPLAVRFTATERSRAEALLRLAAALDQPATETLRSA